MPRIEHDGAEHMSQNLKPHPDGTPSEWLGGEALIGGLPRQRWIDTLPSLTSRIATTGVALVFVSGLVLGLVSSLWIVLPKKPRAST